MECQRRFLADDCPPVVHGVLDVVIGSEHRCPQFIIENITYIVDSNDNTDKMEDKLLEQIQFSDYL